MLQYWLWLSERRKVNNALKLSLLNHFSNPEAVYRARETELRQISGVTEQVLKSLMDKDLEQAQRIETDCAKENIAIAVYTDSAYPRRLKKIADAPILFYYRGIMPDLDKLPSVGIVGTRHASQSGSSSAYRMGQEIGSGGAVVVSGLAAGIDGSAMRGALTSSSPVLGVIGSGIGIIYPKENTDLYRQTEEQGCILSEYPPMYPANRYTFPRRNRLISGLSCGVVIVEAPAKSGALQTAEHARKQHKKVFAVPGDPESSQCAGSNELLAEGAVPVLHGWDVLKEYATYFPDKIHRETAAPPVSQPKPKEPTGQKKTVKLQKSIDKRHSKPYIDLSGMDLSPDALAAAAQLAVQPLTLDELVDAMEQPTHVVMKALTALQIHRVVIRQPGGRFGLAK